jgi:carboxylate-amine ligase
MELLPTAGLPPLMRNWSEYVWLVNHMISTGFIETIRELWWDVRPHHNFGTVEIRMCDMPGNLPDTLALAALVHCLVKSLSDEIDEGAYQHDFHPMMARQNKWRASRYGPAAKLVDADQKVRGVPEIVDRLIEKLRPTAQELGCVAYLEHCREIAAGPSWADRHLAMAAESGSLEWVVRELTQQSRITPPATKPVVSPPHFTHSRSEAPQQTI